MGIVSIMKFATVVAVFDTVARAANLPNKDTASYKKYLENYGPGQFAWDDPEYIKDPRTTLAKTEIIYPKMWAL